MTTSNSPLRILRAQASHIAQSLKAAERGEYPDIKFAEKIAAARQRNESVAGIMMDDKAIKLTIPWAKIADSSEVALTEYILKLMRGQTESH